MTINDLVFNQSGCCGTHSWAEVRHDNGNVSLVYDNGDGTYAVATKAAGMLMRGQENYDSSAGVEQRLTEDAA